MTVWKSAFTKPRLIFSRLLNRVAAGEEVIIERRGTPVAKIVAFGPKPERSLGRDRLTEQRGLVAFGAFEAEQMEHGRGDACDACVGRSCELER